MVSMDTLVNLCKRRGFVFQSSEIYGGLGGVYDYGPLGVELKNNIKRAWWKAVVQEREDMVGLDAAILMHPQVWVASGHAEGFTDPMVDCKVCKKRWRADFVGDHCPECGGELTEPRQFNLMFRTFIGPVEDEAAQIWLRPETAQGIFVNFLNVLSSVRKKLPFGIAQIGKSFRNEITPRNFIFRVREFEQMEIEYFVLPGTDEEWHQRWIEERLQWYVDLGLRRENLRVREHQPDRLYLKSGQVLTGRVKEFGTYYAIAQGPETLEVPKEEVERWEPGELAHYARRCVDIEYRFPIGWQELEGIANRTDFDLRQHSRHSGKELLYFDPESNQHVMPYVIEPSAGVDRSFLAFLADAYHEEEVRGQKRVVLRLDQRLAPIKVAVFPLLRNRPELVEMARRIAADLRRYWMTWYDDTAGIGRLYRRQDEIGTPYCITVDVQSLEDHAVTIRDRDSMEQVRVSTDRLVEALAERLGRCDL